MAGGPAIKSEAQLYDSKGPALNFIKYYVLSSETISALGDVFIELI